MRSSRRSARPDRAGRPGRPGCRSRPAPRPGGRRRPPFARRAATRPEAVSERWPTVLQGEVQGLQEGRLVRVDRRASTTPNSSRSRSRRRTPRSPSRASTRRSSSSSGGPARRSASTCSSTPPNTGTGRERHSVTDADRQVLRAGEDRPRDPRAARLHVHLGHAVPGRPAAGDVPATSGGPSSKASSPRSSRTSRCSARTARRCARRSGDDQRVPTAAGPAAAAEPAVGRPHPQPRRRGRRDAALGLVALSAEADRVAAHRRLATTSTTRAGSPSAAALVVPPVGGGA